MRRFITIFFLLAMIICVIDGCSNTSIKNLFQPHLGSPADSVPTLITESVTDNKQIKPAALTNYSPEAPAPNIPLLIWTIPPGSVYFEIEFLTAAPENPNGISPSIYRFFASRAVYINGYSIDLSAYTNDHLYWRVRGLDLDGNPIGVFSDATILYIDHSLPQTLKPVSNTGYKAANMPMPLYPVYAWIPIYGAVAYEVELTTAAPENPNGILPSKYQRRIHTVKGIYDYYTTYYDEEALSTPGTYYWRVRGLDKSGGPIGVFSDAEPFTVSPAAGSYAATLGDSTTHGGGDMIYSPANVECDYQTYLSFPTMNLGKSADNTTGMLERFDSDVLPFQPEFLIILGGAPSLIEDVPAAQVIGELAAIRDKCLLHGIRPIFLTIPPVNPANIKRTANRDTVSNWREKFITVNDFLRIQKYCIDIEPFFLDADHNLPSYLSIDGIHLGIEGKKLTAQIINYNWPRVTQ
jgi:hypothetical protein